MSETLLASAALVGLSVLFARVHLRPRLALRRKAHALDRYLERLMDEVEDEERCFAERKRERIAFHRRGLPAPVRITLTLY